MRETIIFEKGEHVYLVAPVAPFDPGQSELEEFAFAQALMDQAPNQNIGWLRGQYVEADTPNRNGQMWTSEELAIKSLTPNFMPVTVMHDPRTAVGLIADTKLLTEPERSRIDSTLGIWRHRFPDVWDECADNYERGGLMQSMECLPAYYDCAECERRFPKLPGGAERANWCDHLRAGEVAGGKTKSPRRLGNVTFTGTGLIFETRGATGADSAAHLDVFQDEVAEFHEKAHTGSRHRPRSKSQMDIEQSAYEALVAKAGRVDELETKLAAAEETAAKVPALEADVEKFETEKVAAEKERDDAKAEVAKHEETARTAELATERLGKLGSDFTAKLGERAKGKLTEQAGTLKDEEWADRLEELAELTGVKSDAGEAGKDGGNNGTGNGDGTFSREEVARTQAGGGGGDGGTVEQTPEARRSVVAGLVHPKKAATS